MSEDRQRTGKRSVTVYLTDDEYFRLMKRALMTSRRVNEAAKDLITGSDLVDGRPIVSINVGGDLLMHHGDWSHTRELPQGDPAALRELKERIDSMMDRCIALASDGRLSGTHGIYKKS